MSNLRFIATALAVIALVAHAGAEPRLFIDPLPEAQRARVAARDLYVSSLIPPTSSAYSYFIDSERRWGPGTTVRVAFLGGSVELRQKVKEAASEWMKHANIDLSFEENGKMREWSGDDAQYRADIRVGFDQPGYWSFIGTDSVDPMAAGPGERSLNLGRFDTMLPRDWQATVLHEFGHALGFKHEHQHPTGGCDGEFRWHDDEKYIPTVDEYGQFITDRNGRNPGIYTALGGPPNSWSKEDIDHNLRQLPPSHAYTMGNFDPRSIMKYHFGDWMFVDGTQSRCYSAFNDVLSEGDQRGAATAYPKNTALAKKLNSERGQTYREMLAVPGLAPQAIEGAKARLENLDRRR